MRYLGTGEPSAKHNVNHKISQEHDWKRSRDRTETGAVIADDRDLQIVDGFSGELLRTSRYGTSAQVLEYHEKVLKPLGGSRELLRCDEIQAKYYESFGRRLQRDVLILYNKTLESLGLVELVKDETDRRRWLVRVRKN